jgi:hypothetical protein
MDHEKTRSTAMKSGERTMYIGDDRGLEGYEVALLAVFPGAAREGWDPDKGERFTLTEYGARHGPRSTSPTENMSEFAVAIRYDTPHTLTATLDHQHHAWRS